MTIQQSVLDAILSLENTVQTRWIKRAMVVCPDEKQCITASEILMDMNYVVETILIEHVVETTEDYMRSIDRLLNGLSNVLVTTEAVSKIVMQREGERLVFDVVV